MRERDSGYHRTEAFSDAVIAIIVTIMANDLLQTGEPDGASLATDLVRAWPSYIAFVTSFLVVGQMWVIHHNLWRSIRAVDQGLLLLNLALLLSITILPWSAKLLATHLDGNAAGLNLAAGIYACVALAQALLFNIMLRWARSHDLFDEQLQGAAYTRVRQRFLIGPAAYAVALVVAFVSPYLSLAVFYSVAALYLTTGFVAPEAPTTEA